jgi:cell division transport system permease protein
MRLSFFFREAMRSIRRNPIPSFAAAATVLVTLLVLGVFIPIVQAANGAANDVSSRVQLDVFMVSRATANDNARVRSEIANTPHVKKLHFVSKAQAYRIESRKNPEAYRLLGGTNPLPDKFEIRPDDPSNIAKIAASLPHDQSIDRIVNHQRQTDKIVSGTNALKVAMAILIGLLALASVLLIANTIRLSMFARRREVEVMKLVGATDSFIRWPFLIEGMVLGALGGIGAAFMLLLAKFTILGTLKDEFRHISVSHTIPVAELAVILIGASVLVSAIGSGLSLRRFLRV